MFRLTRLLRKFTACIIVGIILLTPNLLFVFTISASVSPIFEESQLGTTIFVDQNNLNGPWVGTKQHPLRQISAALDVAHPYDTIFISGGVYKETLLLSFPIRLIGIDSPVIDGGYEDKIIFIQSSDVYIDNLQIVHSDGDANDAGLFLKQASNITITNCIIHHTKTGIFLNQSNNVLINNSWFFHSGNAIRTNQSSNILIQNCDFARNSMGLLAQYSSDIDIFYSLFNANGLSCFFDHSSELSIQQCNISNNSVNKGGIFFSDSSNIIVTDTLFRHNGVGISFSNVSSVIVNYCNFVRNTHFAISFRKASRQVEISNCSIQHNIRNGIYIESGNSCKISHSNVMENAIYGILTKPSVTCIAKDNWWGHPTGPWYSFITRSNKVSLFQGKVFVSPWQKTSFSSVGIRYNVAKPRYNNTFDEPISIPCEEVDTDDDKIPDWWEEKWGYPKDEKNDHEQLDPDGDGLTNIQEWYTDKYGSDPFHKDIFLELDWMHCDDTESNKPDELWLQPIVDSYAEHNITLHIDLGSLGGGEEIHYECRHVPTYAALEDMYWKYFLENDLQNPRKNIFHYGLLCNFCPDLNFPFVGWNALDSFAISVEWLAQTYPQYERQQLIAGGIAHHFGHTLGLIADTYQGIDNMDTLRFFSASWWNFHNYQSCMNYYYKFRKLTLSDGSDLPGDFNDWEHLDFSFFQRGTYEEI